MQIDEVGRDDVGPQEHLLDHSKLLGIDIVHCTAFCFHQIECLVEIIFESILATMLKAWQ